MISQGPQPDFQIVSVNISSVRVKVSVIESSGMANRQGDVHLRGSPPHLALLAWFGLAIKPFGVGIVFFNFSTLCIKNVNNTRTKYVRNMKQTAF